MLNQKIHSPIGLLQTEKKQSRAVVKVIKTDKVMLHVSEAASKKKKKWFSDKPISRNQTLSQVIGNGFSFIE